MNMSHGVVLLIALAAGLLIGASKPQWVSTLTGGLVGGS
jgi:hypothetical protein